MLECELSKTTKGELKLNPEWYYSTHTQSRGVYFYSTTPFFVVLLHFSVVFTFKNAL